MPAGFRPRKPEFLLYHNSSLFVKKNRIGEMHKDFPVILCILPVVFSAVIGYNNNVKRECDERLRETFLKEIKVIWKNLLTKFKK